MKAQVLTAESGPDGLQLTEVDDPTPADGQVLVDIKSCGVCFPDLLMSQGKYQLRVPTPFTPGTEVAGVVRSAPDGNGRPTCPRPTCTCPAGKRARTPTC